MQLTIPMDVAVLTALVAAAGLTAVIVLTRINGLRSFAKMAPHDFAATIAIGSILAATAAGSVPLWQGVVALTALYATQRFYQWWRRHGGESVTDNTPLLLMAGDRVLADNLRRGSVTRSDLRGKLREANVVHYGQVLAVVLETTGDISVLHGDPDQVTLDVDLLEGVRGVPMGDDLPPMWHRGPGLHDPNDEALSEGP